MNANLYNTTDYERKRDWTLGENKPNSNPNKPNLQKAKMNINLYVIEDYRKKDDFEVRINKPNLVRRRRIPKMNVNAFLQKDYENEPPSGLEKNKPKTNPILSAVGGFPKGQNRLPENPATPFPSLWKKIIDMLLTLWNNEPPYEGSNENIIGRGCI